MMLLDWPLRIDPDQVDDFVVDVFVNNPAISSWASLHPWLPGIASAETIEELAASIGWSAWDDTPNVSPHYHPGRSGSEQGASDVIHIPAVGFGAAPLHLEAQQARSLGKAVGGMREILHELPTSAPAPRRQEALPWPDELVGPCATGAVGLGGNNPDRSFRDSLFAVLRRLAS